MAWWVAAVRSGKEQRLCQWLGELGIDTYCPMMREIKRVKVRGTRAQYKLQKRYVPVFTGYAFVRAVDGVFDAHHDPIANKVDFRLLSGPDGPSEISDAGLDALKAVRGYVRHDQLRPGSRVVIKTLDGAHGVVTDVGNNTITVRITMLGSSREVTVSPSGISEVIEDDGRAEGSAGSI